ncbi:hypothetical protein QRD02_10445 [Aequorivita sp. SDUM287046]|uniref:Uncharacterized protein n=1 Tax=Aequorivita aurantiaca TaxID=3053356 RepID=A0ABT8DHK8_9FLAO|nr:hypothetical protein [Aequorivita aurantiaca]MDN3724803.1 hypothetical protein [Aequorivita aurantiaca]
MKRIRQVLKDLNVSLERAQEFIYDTTGENLGDANSKITQEIIDLLTEKFQVDKLKKSASDKIREEKKLLLEANRLATIKDIENARNGYNTTTFKLNYFFQKFHLIKSRSNDEWIENSKEVVIDAFEKMIDIHKDKRLPKGYKPEMTPYLDELFENYSIIKKAFHVTKSLKSEFSDRTNRRTEIENENFTWGGLSGEEAYIGYWNTE